MKKLFSLLMAATIIAFGACCTQALAEQTPPHKLSAQQREQMKKEFEQRLNLTDKQKEKAKIIHKEGREQIKPIIIQIEQKRQEIETVKLSRISEKAQQERIDELTSGIRELEKKAQEIRKANSQEFEKILTKKQKNELAKMKAEGRAKFEKNHPPRPPFQGIGAPGFFSPKPLFPQHQQPDFTSK
ncbi:hypothetical protein HDR58_04875 [bacterium]|nr:hypothetical protein [bacterium]